MVKICSIYSWKPHKNKNLCQILAYKSVEITYSLYVAFPVVGLDFNEFHFSVQRKKLIIISPQWTIKSPWLYSITSLIQKKCISCAFHHDYYNLFLKHNS